MHSFEHVTIYLDKFRGLVLLNNDYNINTKQYALGEEIGISNNNINKRLIGAISLVSGLSDPSLIKETIEFEFKRLGDYLLEK